MEKNRRVIGMNVVKIRFPNTNRSCEGHLVGLEKQAQLLIVALSENAALLRPNMLVSVNLIVGGIPRTMTAVVEAIAKDRVSLRPVSRANKHERRSIKRYSVNFPACLLVDGEPSPWQVRIVNISAGGVGFHSEHALQKDQAARLAFVLLGQDSALETKIQVRHTRVLADGLHYIGAAFTDISRTDALWLRKLFP
ncbi:MAG: PilZ domain-containing protein [Armatimonadetes bacterium]|nr:PilZ domain-containing protein [Armatimonadota bacterium]